MAKIPTQTNKTSSGLNLALKFDFPGATGAALDKLEHLTQANTDGHNSKSKAPKIYIQEPAKISTLQKRAKAKFTQRYWLESLARLNSPLHKNYTFALKCSEVLQQKGKKVTAMYCRNRFCLVCNRIATGKLLNGYGATLDGLTDKQFLTLTRPNVPAHELKQELRTMYNTWRRIMKHAVKMGYEINGIRKLEITYNAQRNDYHPHFHLIVEGQGNAQALLDWWLYLNPESEKDAQDLRPCTSYKDLFKYVTKLTAKVSKKDSGAFYPEAIDEIFKAIRGERIFQPFGNVEKVEVNEEIDEVQSQVITDIEETDAAYFWDESDWINVETGDKLTKFSPSTRRKKYRERIKYIGGARPYETPSESPTAKQIFKPLNTYIDPMWN